MGIYIKTAKAPKNCEECDFKATCEGYWKKIREEYTRPSWCPIVELKIDDNLLETAIQDFTDGCVPNDIPKTQIAEWLTELKVRRRGKNPTINNSGHIKIEM